MNRAKQFAAVNSQDNVFLTFGAAEVAVSLMKAQGSTLS